MARKNFKASPSYDSKIQELWGNIIDQALIEKGTSNHVSEPFIEQLENEDGQVIFKNLKDNSIIDDSLIIEKGDFTLCEAAT